MQLAMERTRWSGVSHYSKLPLNYLSAENPVEFMDEDIPLENWQQACIHRTDRISRWNSTGRGIPYDKLKGRPWVDPSCDAYSLGLLGTCSFSRYRRPREEQTQKARQAGYITVGDPYCSFIGPLTPRGPIQRSDSSSERFHPTLAAPKRSINSQHIHMMYRCPSTRPLALWVCLKCSSTSMGTWLLRMENAFLIRRVSQIMDQVRASWSYDGGSWSYNGGRMTSLALLKGIREDFPGSVTDDEELISIARKTLVRFHVVEDNTGNRTNIANTTADVSVRMPRSYCTLCCAWGDGRLRVVVARNPYVRLMSYYKMKMGDDIDDLVSKTPFVFKGWSDFRPWLLTLLSHRERTGRFTSDSADQFTNRKKQHCKQRDPKCVVNSAALDESCALECPDRRPIIPFRDVQHAMPLVDSMFAFGYETHVREGLFQVMHLESIEKDIKDIEERLCREYDDCEPLPEYPHVYPQSVNNDICHFNAKTRVFSNCTVTWEELWPPSLVDLVTLHYAEGFRLLGYKTTPFDLMPIRKNS